MNDDRTALIGGSAPAAGSFDAPASTEACPSCTTSIPPGEQFCPRCGYQRGTWRKAAAGAAAAPAAGQPPAEVARPALWNIASEGGASFPIPAGETLIGRGDVGVKVEDAFVSRQHARIDATAEGFTLTDLGSSNGTFIGERRLAAQESAELASGDSFKVAHTTFRLERAAQASVVEEAEVEVAGEPQQESDPAAVDGTNTMLTHATEPDDTPVDPDSQPEAGKEGHTPHHAAESHWELTREVGDSIALGLGETVLGRKADGGTVVVDGDSYVSGRHCRIIATVSTLEVTDLGSTNGSFVNGARLEAEQPWPLSSGDSLRIGQTEFKVSDSSLTPGQEETLEEEEEES